ncbi:hypothetical protein EYF80_024866 [Liparis tanakae]|uniref:Uncharacterized protein n=1 Tax=Liparis tanakae TaxID=230148 RepID=A0A4Z2HJE2_9TELE|nr:hypothetical protein EYF80_024866 [Liparis tanakae]
MEDILLLGIASHSISRCRGAAAERGDSRAGARDGPLTPPRTSRNELSSSPLTPAVKSRAAR